MMYAPPLPDPPPAARIAYIHWTSFYSQHITIIHTAYKRIYQ